MLTKLATFRGVSEEGEPLVRIFDPGLSLVKQAGEMMPIIKNWMDAYQPDDNKIAVLVNALGSSEYWGQNVNGDIFPESALVHECANHPGTQHPYDDFTGKIIPPYGAWTFMHAHPFVHHQNKDPNRAFGKVVLWTWNPRMHRVELIILLDKKLALEHGAQHVIDRILAGEFPDVSMGCKVPYDICTLCAHKSKTRKDYCNCIRYMGMGKIMDDGRRIGVVNTYPRFFDISFVFIGADKTAKVMCKLGSEQLPQSILDAEFLYGVDNEDGVELVKAASVQVPDNLVPLEKSAGTTSRVVQEAVEAAANPRTRRAMQRLFLKARGRPLLMTAATAPAVAFALNEALEKQAQTNTSTGAGTSGIDLGADTLATGPHIPPEPQPQPALASRVDPQINLERRALADGDVKTNADVNETDEFPEPLMPGRGKLASPLKQLIKEAREKTAAPSALRRAYGMMDKGFTRTFDSRLGAAGLGALTGGGMGAGFGDENRVAGGLIGAGTGALAGLGLSRLTRRIGGLAGARGMGKEVADIGKATEKSKTLGGTLTSDRAAAMARRAELRGKASKGLTPQAEAELRELETKIIPELQSKSLTQKLDASKLVDDLTGAKLRQVDQTGSMKTLGSFVGAGLGGLGAGTLAAEPFHKESAAGSEESGQYGSMKPVWEAAKRMKIGPPPKPNRKKFPFTGSINFRGLEIHVENNPGSVREGKNPAGKVIWRTPMKLAYGEFNGTRGIDKDKLDVYVGPYRMAPNVYIIHQNFVRGPKKGKYDEDKVMVGFESLEQAKLAYLAHYNSPKYFRSATVMAFPLFKKAIIKKEVHGEKVASAYVHTMEKRAEDLKLEDLFNGAKTAGRRSKVWRHSNGRELRRTGSGMDDWGVVKEASVAKYAALEPRDLLKVSAEKWADIVKHIGPDKAVGKVSPMLSDSEPQLPKESLDAMSSCGMEKALATPSMMGMVLKPEEFQRIHLNCMGKGGLADKMDDAGATFKPSEEEQAPCQELNSDQLDPEMMKMLMPLMRDRSYFGPAVRRRIIQISVIPPKPLTSSTEVNSPLLSKVASAYNWYRREQMKLAADAMTVVPNNPDLHSGLYGMGDADLFGKSAAKGVDTNTLAVVLGSVPITLMYSAHLRGEKQKGKELGILKDLVAEHPWLATSATAAGLRELMKSPKAKQAVSELMAAGKRIFQTPASAVA